MPQKITMADALNNRRKVLVKRLSMDRVRNSPKKLIRIAHELREISKRLDVFDSPK